MNQSGARIRRLLGIAAAVAAIFNTGGGTAKADYVQTNLVSDIPSLATATDPNLHNPWGLSHLATSPFWVSDQVNNVATLYNVTGSTNVTINPLVVSIPTTASGPQGPTGQVANSDTSSFLVNGTSARFLFANLNGQISAFTGGTNAVTAVPASGSVYTGLAISGTGANARLYAASATGINTFDNNFNPILPGGFMNPNISGLVPFNVQAINGKIYVTYAPPGRPAQQNATEGQGAVAIFDTNGNLLQNLVVGSKLASPWGVTVAPSNFGQFSGDLLVGNFSFNASEINAFDANGTFEGTIPIDIGGNMPGGLWALGFGSGGSNGSPDTLYFTDGINHEVDGLFGAINSVPGPAAGAGIPGLVASFVGFLTWVRRRRRREITPETNG